MSLPRPSDFATAPLPQPNPIYVAEFPQIYAAFNLCLSLESRAHLVPLPHPGHPTVEVCARVLGYALIEMHTVKCRAHMAQAINGSTDDTLLALGEYYIKRLLRMFKGANGRTPAPSNHPSRPDVDDAHEFFSYHIEQGSQNQSTAKKAALHRDGYHCILKTDMYDTEYLDKNMSTVLAQHPTCDSEPLKCAHIFPEGLNSDLGDNTEIPTDKRQWVASVWAVMFMFGIELEELNGTGPHRLENILTLCSGLHEYFHRLALWLHAVENNPNTYVVVSTSEATLRRLPNRIVTFTSPNPRALPLPKPDYLAIHAACCRIAHMSGAADYAEKVLRDEEEIRVQTGSMGNLAADGSSMELFNEYITAAVRVV
ncbi:hypothetical protein ARMGADRAFT_1020439 [Armillaria gallica]|uniref:HNH nuclease domain-containing protein n=1 Tax=Armillaria gallica TaxID=47427 RepID=A0A2H3CE01_ARMGA|nr:hypothetical protein ARMGADRAFT_1020439 [Armillaria gallica]